MMQQSNRFNIPRFADNRFLHVAILLYLILWIAMAIAPRDWPTWALENLLVGVFVAVLIFAYRWFAFSNASYFLILGFLSLHAIGAHSGYAHTPIGDWLKASLSLQRNPYDRIIHFSFGLLLAYPVAELLVRTGGIRRTPALWFSPCVILGVSALFEVIEAIVAETVQPGAGPDWLGGQGDIWDSQWDMTVATVGALLCMGLTAWLRPARSRENQ